MVRSFIYVFIETDVDWFAHNCSTDSFNQFPLRFDSIRFDATRFPEHIYSNVKWTWNFPNGLIIPWLNAMQCIWRRWVTERLGNWATGPLIASTYNNLIWIPFAATERIHPIPKPKWMLIDVMNNGWICVAVAGGRGQGYTWAIVACIIGHALVVACVTSRFVKIAVSLIESHMHFVAQTAQNYLQSS